MKIYVAGPFSRNAAGEKAFATEVFYNMRVGVRAAVEVLQKGHAPFCPFLDYQYFLMLREDESISEEQIKTNSLIWIGACDAILLLPNWEMSPGTRAEFQEAQRLGLKVFMSIGEIPEVKNARERVQASDS